MKKLFILLLILIPLVGYSQVVRTAVSGEDTNLTTGNTQTTVFGITVDPNVSGYFYYSVICQRVSDGATKAWFFTGSFKKVGSNAVVVTLVPTSTPSTTGDALSLVLTTTTVNTDTDNMYFDVQGLSSTSIIWYARMDGFQIYNN